MKTFLTYTTITILAFILAVVLYKWMADEPIIPRIEKTNLTPEYQFPQFPYDKG